MFNKNFSKIMFASAALVLGLVACKKEVNDDIIVPPTVVKFATVDTGSVAAPKVYYVENTPTSQWAVPVGFTTVSDRDRTINISYTSPTGAAQGVQFTAPTTITIPAGQASDTIYVKGLFAGFPNNRIDSVRISVSSPDAPTAPYAGLYRLVMRPYCPVSLANLAGNYTNTREFNAAGAQTWGPYTTRVKNLVSTGATTATGQIENLYDDGWNDINATFNWTNPANFTVTIANQPTGKGYNVVSTSGTFSSCERSITIVTNLAPGTASQVTGYRFVLR